MIQGKATIGRVSASLLGCIHSLHFFTKSLKRVSLLRIQDQNLNEVEKWGDRLCHEMGAGPTFLKF